MRAALIAYKERGRRDLARPLGELLARAIGSGPESGPGSLVLVPVPSTPGRRGPAAVITSPGWPGSPAGALGAGVVGALRLGRPVYDSAGLEPVRPGPQRAPGDGGGRAGPVAAQRRDRR